ncbi:MAG TPA: glutathione S-transferase family protein [Verrucomicrobiae bacterium]|nr:glutathione S-transferase family protein [Verrucomicrobiae bacterium]
MTASAAPRLITIRLSHYCEKARWGLDYTGAPYFEQAVAPPFHRLKRSAGGTVPVLVDGERRLGQSHDILVHADRTGRRRLYPDDPAALRAVQEHEQAFDKELGPAVRRYCYWLLLGQTRLLSRVWSDGVPPWQAALMPALAPAVVALVKRSYRVTPDSAKRSFERVMQAWARVEAQVTTKRWLVGNAFSAADLTLCALSAPMVLAPEYGGSMPHLDELPAGSREGVEALRKTVVGAHVMRTYATLRHQHGADAQAPG